MTEPTLTATPAIGVALVAGWFAARRRIDVRAFEFEEEGR